MAAILKPMTKTKFQLPFKGLWFTFWGGDTEVLNGHHGSSAQNYALDFVKKDSVGKTHQKKGLVNEDYYCFGEDVLAPARGYVVEVVDGVRDNKPGDTNRYVMAGNYILIKHNENEFSYLAHLKSASLSVQVGEAVRQGQKIGECGNSGNSVEPHLHYHVQDSFIFNRYDENGNTEEIARGINIRFSKVILNKITKEEYGPIKGDVVSNVASRVL